MSIKVTSKYQKASLQNYFTVEVPETICQPFVDENYDHIIFQDGAYSGDMRVKLTAKTPINNFSFAVQYNFVKASPELKILYNDNILYNITQQGAGEQRIEFFNIAINDVIEIKFKGDGKINRNTLDYLCISSFLIKTNNTINELDAYKLFVGSQQINKILTSNGEEVFPKKYNLTVNWGSDFGLKNIFIRAKKPTEQTFSELDNITNINTRHHYKTYKLDYGSQIIIDPFEKDTTAQYEYNYPYSTQRRFFMDKDINTPVYNNSATVRKYNITFSPDITVESYDISIDGVLHSSGNTGAITISVLHNKDITTTAYPVYKNHYNNTSESFKVTGNTTKSIYCKKSETTQAITYINNGNVDFEKNGCYFSYVILTFNPYKGDYDTSETYTGYTERESKKLTLKLKRFIGDKIRILHITDNMNNWSTPMNDEYTVTGWDQSKTVTLNNRT